MAADPDNSQFRLAIFVACSKAMRIIIVELAVTRGRCDLLRTLLFDTSRELLHRRPLSKSSKTLPQVISSSIDQNVSMNDNVLGGV